MPSNPALAQIYLTADDTDFTDNSAYFLHMRLKIKDLTHILCILLKEFANLFEVFKNFCTLVEHLVLNFIIQDDILLWLNASTDDRSSMPAAARV